MAWIGLPAPISLLQLLLFFSSSCARWFPTRSKRTVLPSSSFIPNSVLLADTGQLAPESLAARFAELAFSESAAGGVAFSGVAAALEVCEAQDMSTRTPL
ncbi:exported hypothetical protein [Candidatus Sulfopaludibacter sp. SbA4]|nr:exported hypothetical protein [Candidatus Sulfopaludibacter sp. SbA4]